jgi:hypothetical protein
MREIARDAEQHQRVGPCFTAIGLVHFSFCPSSSSHHARQTAYALETTHDWRNPNHLTS